MPEMISFVMDDGTPRHIVFRCADAEDFARLETVMAVDHPLLLQSPDQGQWYLLPVRHTVDPGEGFPRSVRVVMVESERP